MHTQPVWFEELAARNWSQAVIEATARFPLVRSQVIAGLSSLDERVRSAAVATLNEANDASAHDLVASLARDADEQVQHEVFEYLGEFPKQADIPLLLWNLRSRTFLFLSSSALQTLCGGVGPLIEDDDDPRHISESLAEWERVLRNRGVDA